MDYIETAPSYHLRWVHPTYHWQAWRGGSGRTWGCYLMNLGGGKWRFYMASEGHERQYKEFEAAGDEAALAEGHQRVREHYTPRSKE